MQLYPDLVLELAKEFIKKYIPPKKNNELQFSEENLTSKKGQNHKKPARLIKMVLTDLEDGSSFIINLV